jgi:membrane protease YdiL (CAAX protease family)
VADIDPDQGSLEGGGAPRRPPGPAPKGFLPADRLVATPSPAGAPWRDSLVLPGGGGGGDNGSFLDRCGVPPTTKSAAWRWLFYALLGILVGQLAAGVFGFVAGDVAGKNAAQMAALTSAAVPPEWYVISSLVGLWVGFFGAPWVASRTQGTRHFLADLGVRFRWVDLWGLGMGVGAQYAIVLLYLPFQHDIHNFNAPNQKLTGGAHGVGVLVVVLATVILAPAMEELFFRGLVFKALARLFTPLGPGTTRARGVGVVLAVIADGLLFGLAHFEWVQFAGLALFGALLAAISYRSGRLGMNMLAHASFNLVAVVTILNQRGGVIH